MQLVAWTAFAPALDTDLDFWIAGPCVLCLLNFSSLIFRPAASTSTVPRLLLRIVPISRGTISPHPTGLIMHIIKACEVSGGPRHATPRHATPRLACMDLTCGSSGASTYAAASSPHVDRREGERRGGEAWCRAGVGVGERGRRGATPPKAVHFALEYT